MLEVSYYIQGVSTSCNKIATTSFWKSNHFEVPFIQLHVLRKLGTHDSGHPLQTTTSNSLSFSIFNQLKYRLIGPGVPQPIIAKFSFKPSKNSRTKKHISNSQVF